MEAPKKAEKAAPPMGILFYRAHCIVFAFSVLLVLSFFVASERIPALLVALD